MDVFPVLERSAYGSLYLKQYSNDTKKRKTKKNKKNKKKVEEPHAPRTIFSSRGEYFPHSANINLKVWSLFHHDSSIFVFHFGFIFK